MSEAEDFRAMDPAEAAAYWMLLRDDGRDLAHDAEFQGWLEQPGATKAWASAERIWASLDDEPEDPLMEAMRRSALSARKPAFRFEYRAFSAVAAALLLAVGGTLGVHHWSIGADRAPPEIASVLSTNPGETREVSLSDGTVLALSGASKVEVLMSKGRRDATLVAGEVFFKVVHDAARPFVLKALDRTVTDLGTEFDVAVTPASMQVTLVSGRVAVAGTDGSVALAPGQQFKATEGQAGGVSQVDTHLVLSWRDGFIIFHSDSLSDAVIEFNRTLKHPIMLAGNIGSYRLSGRFKAGDGEAFIAAATAIYPLKATHHHDGSVTLSPR